MKEGYNVLTNAVPKLELGIGEDVECTFVGLRPAKFGQIPVFKKEDGKEFFIGGKIVFEAVKDLDLGSQVCIEYNGEETSKAGRTYKSYSVGVKGA